MTEWSECFDKWKFDIKAVVDKSESSLANSNDDAPIRTKIYQASSTATSATIQNADSTSKPTPFADLSFDQPIRSKTYRGSSTLTAQNSDSASKPLSVISIEEDNEIVNSKIDFKVISTLDPDTELLKYIQEQSIHFSNVMDEK